MNPACCFEQIDFNGSAKVSDLFASADSLIFAIQRLFKEKPVSLMLKFLVIHHGQCVTLSSIWTEGEFLNT